MRSGVLENLADVYRAHTLPLKLHLDLTFRCPLKCLHCYVSGENAQEMTTHEVKHVLSDARRLRVFVLLISGGEPMLRDDLFEILEAARRLHFYIHLKTTGIYLGEKEVKKFARLGPIRVDLSVHGASPETHDRFVGMRGAFQKTVAAFELLQKYGVRTGIRTNIVAANVAEAAKIESVFCGPNVDFKQGLLLFSRRDGKRPFENLELSDQDCLRILSKPMEQHALPPFDFERPLCGAAALTLYVGPDGTIFPCTLWPEPIGNAREREGLRKAFYGERAREIRAMRQGDRVQCLDCPVNAICPFCPGESYAQGLKPTDANPVACRFGKLLMQREGLARKEVR